MDASGHLYPAIRRNVCAPEEGELVQFDVDENDVVPERRPLFRLYSSPIRTKMSTLDAEAKAAGTEADECEVQARRPDISPVDKANLLTRAEIKRAEQANKKRELEDLKARIGARQQPGDFAALAPVFTPEERRQLREPKWTVLTGDFQKERGKMLRPSEPILRLGASAGPWELELKIPQKHIGQILAAFDRIPADKPKELDVDYVLQSRTTLPFKGKLARNRIAGEALPSKDDNDESEPVVLAFVRISGQGIAPEDTLPRSLLLSDTGVKAKVRCGPRAMGYSMFYGVWEFFYEKVVFFF
jgi:hypothetical protein